MQTWHALVLGLVEGLTEYIPVSSTAHILLSERLLGLPPSGKSFEVVIQLGAILALMTVYASRIWRLLTNLLHDRRTQTFALAVIAGFVPAAIVGATLYKFIKSVLFDSPMLICVMLVLGGIVLLFIDRIAKATTASDALDIGPVTGFKIGLFQCLAVIPGVSRSGSTIVGAMLLGVEKRAAAEFSFFLAIPTMLAACLYDFYKNWPQFSADDLTQTAIGFAAAFVSGIFVVRGLLDFISTRGLAFFGWWRIIAGGIGIGALTALNYAA